MEDTGSHGRNECHGNWGRKEQQWLDMYYQCCVIRIFCSKFIAASYSEFYWVKSINAYMTIVYINKFQTCVQNLTDSIAHMHAHCTVCLDKYMHDIMYMYVRSPLGMGTSMNNIA